MTIAKICPHCILNIVILRRSRAQTIQTGNSGGFRKIKNAKESKSTQLYDNVRKNPKKKLLRLFNHVARV